MVKFSKANSKLRKLYKVKALSAYLMGKRKVYSFDSLSGWACPFAYDCQSKVVELDNGQRKIQDGQNTQFRCFSASQEVVFPTTYDKRKANFEAIKACKSLQSMVTLIESNMPKDAGIVRIHVSGDFFSQLYFDAWLEIAKAHPNRLFYAYTKSLPYWVKRISDIPENMVLTASRGGRMDRLIDKYKLREAIVVFSQQEALDKGLEIDDNDSHAAIPSQWHQSFALLIHGVQPKGSKAAKALQLLKKAN